MTTAEMIHQASQLVNPQSIDNAEMGSVASILITDRATVFQGVCIDTICGMGFCAEHTAISQMITQGEYRIAKIVAVKKDDQGNVYVMAPCGRCREFMYQTNKQNIETEVVLGKDKVVRLADLLPFQDWQERVID
ncbi:MAG: cytidine deaminase [Bacteroidota bacterium]